MIEGFSNMKSGREILREHYICLLKRIATWSGLAAMMASSFVALPVSASTQMGARSATATTLKAGTNANYSISITPGTTGTIGSIKFEICDSPLESVSCAASLTPSTNSKGASMASTTLSGPTGTGWTGGTWGSGGTTGPGTSGTSIKFTNSGTAVSPTNAQPGVWTLNTVLNPEGNNQKYYLRVTTYSDTAYTTAVDFGAMALQTAQDVVVSATVQESLTFCTGGTVTAGCSSVGSGSVSLSTGNASCPILGTSYSCTGTSQMAAATNASSGYTITYKGTTFTGPSDTITQTGEPGAPTITGTKQFGLAITSKTGSGTGGVIAATYDFSSNGSKYAFTTTGTPTVASSASATDENVYTVTYNANVSPMTKPGVYTSTFNYVCTGNF